MARRLSDPSEVQAILLEWPDKPRQVGSQMIERYGP